MLTLIVLYIHALICLGGESVFAYLMSYSMMSQTRMPQCLLECTPVWSSVFNHIIFLEQPCIHNAVTVICQAAVLVVSDSGITKPQDSAKCFQFHLFQIAEVAQYSSGIINACVYIINEYFHSTRCSSRGLTELSLLR